MDMELDKKTTILFPRDLYEHLAEVARAREKSVGQLVREACVAAYGARSPADRIAAARDLAALELPVSTPAEMKRESVPDPDSLIP